MMRIRDAVSGDIVLNELEEYCVRHPSFQRLHGIKQLGNAFQIYPSAMHTRFEHSLGVSHQVKKLLAQPEFFPRGYNVDKSKRNLLELSGLLHDIIHTPFKHTLDRDSGILPEPEIFEEYRYRLNQLDLSKKLGKPEIDFLLKILGTKDPFDLDEPFFRQIIEDTISADLLDYSRRDAYFTGGWMRHWDERIYDHIAIARYNQKPHLVAKLTDIRGRITPSAVTELVNLLQIRYMLNERVYFYPTKIAADSLLVKSIRFLILKGRKKPRNLIREFREMSDEEMVQYLMSSDVDETRYHAQNLKRRVLPGLVYGFKHNEFAKPEQDKIASCCRGYEMLEQWKDVENKICKDARVEAGTIIIYCHNPEMQYKEPNFLVYYDGRHEPESVVNNKEMSEDIRAIAQKHKNLWRCYVFSYERSQKAIENIKRISMGILKNM